MSRIPFRILSLLLAGGLCSPATAFAWQSPTARKPFDFEAISAPTSDDELVLQDKAPAKPTETTKPPAKPATPTRPAPRPATPPQPLRPEPQFNPFVNPQPNQPYVARECSFLNRRLPPAKGRSSTDVLGAVEDPAP